MTPADPTPPGHGEAGSDRPALVDPVLSELHRRRPDVDVVVLAPEDARPPTPGAQPRAVDLAGARDVVRRVHALIDVLLAGLEARDAWHGTDDPPASTRTWTGRSGDPTGCVYAASVGLGVDDEHASRGLLEQVGDLLLAHGQDARPVVGRRLRLLSSDGRLVVEAEARGPHVRVEVRSLPLLLTRDDLVALRATDRSAGAEDRS